jgi:hypothetical protein
MKNSGEKAINCFARLSMEDEEEAVIGDSEVSILNELMNKRVCGKPLISFYAVTGR